MAGGGELAQEVLESLVGGHAHARERPAAEIVKLGFGALTLHFVERASAGVGGGDKRAHAGAGDEVDWDFVLFEDAQDADMRDAAREAASERDAHFRTGTLPGVGERAQALDGFG